VFIIDEVHMLSTSAFNALLKTLEEPPARVLFILATTELHKVPQTIISRCQHFDFRRVPVDAIIGRLELLVRQEDKQVDAAVLESVAYTSQGCLRDAESLLGQILSLGDKHITATQAELVLPRPQFAFAIEFITRIHKRELSAALTLVHTLIESGSGVELFVDDVIVLARQLLLAKVAGADTMRSLPKSVTGEMQALVKDVPLQLIQQLLETLIDTRQRMKFVDITSLPLELAIIRLIGDAEPGNTRQKPDNSDTFGGSGDVTETPKKNTVSSTPKAPEKKEPAKMQSVDKPKATAVLVTLDEINERWNDFLVEIKRHNQSVASALKIGQPTGIAKSGEVVIAFQHRFHRERINESKIKLLVERVLSDLLGKQLYIQTVIDASITATTTTSAPEQDDLQAIVQNFSGQLID
jgi:DNA polymerase-3 subunit gamma/tau